MADTASASHAGLPGLDRWVRRLILAYLILIVPALLVTGWLYWTRPLPLAFPAAESTAQLASDARKMKRHLDAHSIMQRVGVSRVYFEIIHDSILDPGQSDYARNRPLKDSVGYLHYGYLDVFLDYQRLLLFLMGLCCAGALAACATWLRPSVPTALLMLLVALSSTSPGTEFFAGEDYSSLYYHALPHAGLALALVVLLVRRLTIAGSAGQQQQWREIVRGSLLVLIGIGALVWTVASGSHPRPQNAAGTGVLLGHGLLSLFRGIRGLSKVSG